MGYRFEIRTVCVLQTQRTAASGSKPLAYTRPRHCLADVDSAKCWWGHEDLASAIS